MRTFFGCFIILLSLPAFSQKNIQLRSTLSYGRQISNVWGYADSLQNEYALVGVNDGLSIVDVTDPDSIIELFHIPGPRSNWHEIKTWNHFAYVTNESDSGLLIVNLGFLPDSVHYSYWGDSAFQTAHTLFIDEKGILYLFGYNDELKSVPFDNRGALICDLNPDPENPEIIARFSTNYAHDGYVRNDTLWAALISEGVYSVVDVTDTANITVITRQETPHHFTHNCWLSDDGGYLFTTDERPNAFITSFDVSDVGNITEIDRWRVDTSGLVPHNTHYVNGYLVTSYYKYGMNIIDAHNPAHLVETGFYDTSPFPNSEGFSGCWGVYPYLPSGTILASDVETGLYVLTPDYQRACYLKGTVTDSTSRPLFDVTVEIMGTNAIEATGADGVYKSGTADPGMYDVRFYRPGCIPVIVQGVELQRDSVSTLDIALVCTSYATPAIVPDKIELAVYPTMFSSNTSVRYVLPANHRTQTDLQLFDASGRLVNTVRLPDREGEIILGNDLAPGMYLLRLTNGAVAKTVKVVKTG